MSTHNVKARSGLRLFVLIIFWTLTQAACATQPATPTPQLSSIKDHPGFSHFKSTLIAIAQERAPEQKGTHHFFVAKYVAAEQLTYMYWLEGRKLWILTPGGTTEESWLGMRYPSGGQLLDVDKDVVATEKEVGGSSYLVTQPWMQQRIYDTVVLGDLIKINTP
ncbi:hypothetical protein [Teredinibacter sp. KSP-S5-2]|uniref:hypothetical protein n=1 Tax=Teredinibacter sp. KSP-S5-2 TaxID=3034506 RepID=UPI00293529B2|nr:hypothetical protein [Teredinibacter sp. KSP-S5-2]WNO09027.1 hypothetical protein P5V12_18960 [Teredinibacter sp. KSP-S5-2]